MNAVKYVVSAFLLAVLAGCASYPISKNLRQEEQFITISQVKSDPAGTQGAVVIWGGRIIKVVNNTNGSSLYVLCLPMGPDEKPVAYGPSPGRFIARSTQFLDPETFPVRARVTVAGQLAGVWTEKLGDFKYTYPVVDIRQTVVWPREPEGPVPYYGYYGPDWDWGWGWGPGWWWGAGFYYPYYYGGYYRGYWNHGGYWRHGYDGGGYHGDEGYHGGYGGSAGAGWHGR